MKKNLLIQSDNLFALDYLLNKLNLKGKIDLIYIDPPFATGSTFIISNKRASSVSRSKKGQIAYKDNLAGSDYLNFIKERLILLKELMSANGSIYFHIDYKIGHKIKILMDEVFGEKNFKNDITRIKCNPKNFKRLGYSNIKDLILFYTKSNQAIWNEPKSPYSESDIVRLFPKIDKSGKRYTTVPIHAPGESKSGKSNKLFRGMKPPKGRHWRTDPKKLEKMDDEGLIEWSSNNNPRQIYYANEDGKRITDIWEFKDPQYPVYPTEKNFNLLDLIIKTSSNQKSIILDCYCGSGTTILAAQQNQRKWIGIDNSQLAIKKTKEKLGDNKDLFNSFIDYKFLNFTKRKKI